jgi:hypothetical protein
VNTKRTCGVRCNPIGSKVHNCTGGRKATANRRQPQGAGPATTPAARTRAHILCREREPASCLPLTAHTPRTTRSNSFNARRHTHACGMRMPCAYRLNGRRQRRSGPNKEVQSHTHRSQLARAYTHRPPSIRAMVALSSRDAGTLPESEGRHV